MKKCITTFLQSCRSVFNVLKNGMNLEHTRHRSPLNFLIHIVAYITAYAIKKLPRSFVNEFNLELIKEQKATIETMLLSLVLQESTQSIIVKKLASHKRYGSLKSLMGI